VTKQVEFVRNPIWNEKAQKIQYFERIVIPFFLTYSISTTIIMKEETDQWYVSSEIKELDTPMLIVYKDRVIQNIQTAIAMIGNVERLRPHIKTNKSEEVSRLMLKAGIKKFKCATIAEAEMLGICGAPDVLLAYQPIGPKCARFVSLIEKFPFTSYSCLVDHPEAAKQMSVIFSTRGLKVPVYLDLNLGQNRTGIVPDEHAFDLWIICAALPGIKPIGLHGYDGHIRDQDWNARKNNCDVAFERIALLAKIIAEKGFSKPIIVAGGSPTFSIHCKRKNIECSPGTFVYWDKGYLDLCPEQDFIPAALVITRIVSFPDNAKICVDLGHKSVGAENDLARRVFFLNAPELKPIGQSEEHLVLEAGTGHSYQIGDVLYGLPYHICPTVALYERAIVIEEGKASGEWKNISRNRKISI
jgi:D-serine deaminase-like pyridoxal phosphate-dependent protein